MTDQNPAGQLLFGLGSKPGAKTHAKTTAKAINGSAEIKKAVKCDMYREISSGPTCVRA